LVSDIPAGDGKIHKLVVLLMENKNSLVNDVLFLLLLAVTPHNVFNLISPTQDCMKCTPARAFTLFSKSYWCQLH
jgi:hypothetical protein